MQATQFSFVPIYRLIIISSPLWLNDFYFAFLADDAHELRLVLDILFYIVFQSIIIALAYEAGWFRFANLGLTIADLFKQVLSGIALLVLVLVITVIIKIVFELIRRWTGVDWTGSGHPDMPGWSPPLVFMYVLYLSLTAGVYEEIVYRGISIKLWSDVTDNRIVQIVGSAAVFALIHWSLGGLILALAFVLGLFWAVLYMRTGKLLPIMIAHFLFDFITFYEWHTPLIEGVLNSI